MASSIWGSVGRLGALLLLVTATLVQLSAALALDLCSSFNTASMDKNVSIYQTNGLCSDFCRSDWAWAITQEEDCWCSNFTPSKSSQVNLDKCDINCPAYPDEHCGGRGLYGYLELKVQQPSGTKGPPQSTSTSETSSTEETSSMSSTPSLDSSTDDDDAASTSMVQTLTTDGTVKTVTVVPTGADDADHGNQEDPSGDNGGGGGLGTGPIVGIVVGVVGVVLIAAGIAVFWFLRRRKRNQQDGYQDDPSVRGNSSDRMGSAHPEMSMGGGASPTSGVGGSNRNSTLAIDPRMDPFKQGLYNRDGSRESIDTLRDDHDYSRRIQQPKVLRATNPDPTNDD